MVNVRSWRPDPLPQERQGRQIRSVFPGSGDGYMGSTSLVSRGKTSASARQKGADNDKEYTRVWEQTAEPEEAAVHDFWWVP